MELSQIDKKNLRRLTIGNVRVYFSYETPVVLIDYNTANHYKTSDDYSRTTTKHINHAIDRDDVKTVEPVNQGELEEAIEEALQRETSA